MRHLEMRRPRWRAVVGVTVLTTLLGAGGLPVLAESSDAVTAPTCQGRPAPWMDTALAPDKRAQLLVSAMTIEQEAEMTAGVSTATEFREVPALPQLCIPALLLTNGPAGISTNTHLQQPATALPAPIGLAANWDPAVARRYGAVQGAEATDQARNDVEGPDIDIARVPENGRTFEAYGEDPYLTGTVSASDITGIQSKGVIATAKHFTANNQETDRSTINEIIDPRTLQEIYIAPYASVVRAGVGSVMCALPQVNGDFACQSAPLLGTLDHQLGFPGFVVSDFGAIHSTVAAATAGSDLELPVGAYFGPSLAQAVSAGQLSKGTLDAMVERILRTMFAFGLFDRAAPTPRTIPARADGAVARQIATTGTVLLQDTGALLPLDPATVHSLAVVGPEAGVASSGGDGSSKVDPLYTVSPIAGVTARGARAGISVTGVPAPPVSLGHDDGVPSSALAPPGAGPGQHGLRAKYYANLTLQGAPAATRVEPWVDTDGLPPTQVDRSNGWSVRWTGTLTAPATGLYTLSLTANADASMTLDGKTIMSDPGVFPAKYASASIQLQAGVAHQIEVDYASTTSGLVTLGWQLPAGVQSPVITQAVTAAQHADAAVVFVGDAETEGIDRPGLALPGLQDQLIEAVAAANPRTVVVLDTGGPVLMPWLSQVAGVVEAWYPGEEDGNAISSILFGDTDPSGKLPITFPASDTAVPASTPQQYPGVDGDAVYSERLDVGYRWDDATGTTPLFPFGFGLSYTSFAFSGLSVATGPSGTANVTADVTDTGSRAGAEVAQLYVGFPATAGEPPRQLKGFAKVSLLPGESRQVTFSLTRQALSWWDPSTGKWSEPPGTFTAYVGDSSALADLPLEASFTPAG